VASGYSEGGQHQQSNACYRANYAGTETAIAQRPQTGSSGQEGNALIMGVLFKFLITKPADMAPKSKSCPIHPPPLRPYIHAVRRRGGDTMPLFTHRGYDWSESVSAPSSATMNGVRCRFSH
jgi:hypothetical protein